MDTPPVGADGGAPGAAVRFDLSAAELHSLRGAVAAAGVAASALRASEAEGDRRSQDRLLGVITSSVEQIATILHHVAQRGGDIP